MDTPEPSKQQLHQLKALFDNEDGNDIYDRITNFIPGIVYVYDTKKKKLRYINKRVTEILGYSFDDVTTWDDDWKNLIFDEDKELVSTELEKFYGLKDNESHSYNSRLNHKEGNWRYFKTQGTVLRRGDNGGPESILFIAQDITEQLKTAEENKKLLEVLEETQLMLDFGVWTINIKTMMADCSTGFFRLLEIDADENKQITLDDYISYIYLPDKERVVAAIFNAIESKTEFEIEHAILTNNNVKKVVLCKGKVVVNDKSNALKLVGSTMNITKVRNAEYALGNKIEDLNRSNKDLEDFAYIASHDLQEPLRKISTFGQRLATKYKEVLTEEGQVYLTRMMSSTEIMRQLIDNLLEYSRITRNLHSFIKVDLNIILKTVTNELDLIIEETGTTIVATQLPIVVGMNLQLKQLFINLITNAIKFRQKHLPCIITITSKLLGTDECIAHGLALDKQYFNLSFADNGIGFEEEYAEKIFIIFQRLHGKAEYLGSGIGLSICKKIVDNHQGHMYAQGILNVGATFNIILPQ